MGSVPTQTNTFGVTLNELIHMLVDGAGAKAVETYAETQIPLLHFPVIQQIFEYIVEHELDKVSLVFQEGAIHLVFTVQTDSELGRAVSALSIYQKLKGSNDQAAITKAQQDAINAWGNIIHWDGTAPTQ